MTEPTPDNLTAESAAAPDAERSMYDAGKTTWHSSDEDSGPDVGLSLGLGDGKMLWIGEIVQQRYEDGGESAAALGSSDGWWLMIYPEGRLLAKFTDTETARDYFEIMERICAERIAAGEWEARVRALEFAEEEARRYAKCYAHGSDGRNTFVMFAERMEREAALITAAEIPLAAVEAPMPPRIVTQADREVCAIILKTWCRETDHGVEQMRSGQWDRHNLLEMLVDHRRDYHEFYNETQSVPPAAEAGVDGGGA